MNSLPGRPVPNDEGMGFILGGAGIAAITAIFGGSYLIYRISDYFNPKPVNNSSNETGVLDKTLGLLPYATGGLGLGFLSRTLPEESKARKVAAIGAVGVGGYGVVQMLYPDIAVKAGQSVGGLKYFGGALGLGYLAHKADPGSSIKKYTTISSLALGGLGLAKLFFPDIMQKAFAQKLDKTIFEKMAKEGIKSPVEYADLVKNTNVLLSSILEENAKSVSISLTIKNTKAPVEDQVYKSEYYFIRMVSINRAPGQATEVVQFDSIATPGIKPGAYKTYKWRIDSPKYPNSESTFLAIVYKYEDKTKPLIMKKVTLGSNVLNLLS